MLRGTQVQVAAEHERVVAPTTRRAEAAAAGTSALAFSGSPADACRFAKHTLAPSGSSPAPTASSAAPAGA